VINVGYEVLCNTDVLLAEGRYWKKKWVRKRKEEDAERMQSKAILSRGARSLRRNQNRFKAVRSGNVQYTS
jgi:hypothetical protein